MHVKRVSEIQRARILTAMVELVAERGAANVTVAHIVGCSGVSRRTFYELFEDREACFLVAFDEAIEKITRRRCRPMKTLAMAREDPGRTRRAAGLLDHQPNLGRLVVVETLGAGAAHSSAANTY